MLRVWKMRAKRPGVEPDAAEAVTWRQKLQGHFRKTHAVAKRKPKTATSSTIKLMSKESGYDFLFLLGMIMVRVRHITPSDVVIARWRLGPPTLRTYFANCRISY